MVHYVDCSVLTNGRREVIIDYEVSYIQFGIIYDEMNFIDRVSRENVITYNIFSAILLDLLWQCDYWLFCRSIAIRVDILKNAFYLLAKNVV